MAEIMDKKLAKRFGQILKQEAAVLDARHNVDKLRAHHAEITNADRTTSKLTGWRNLFAIQKGIDAANRPSDQRYNARIYSKIDDGVWSQAEMRGWYQQYAVPMPRESVDSVATEYMKNPTQLQRQQLEQSKYKSQHQFASSSMSPPPSKLTGKGQPLKQPLPSFIDFEANLKLQREECARFLKERPNFPPSVDTLTDAPGVPRVPGFRRAPWKDRPHG